MVVIGSVMHQEVLLEDVAEVYRAASLVPGMRLVGAEIRPVGDVAALARTASVPLGHSMREVAAAIWVQTVGDRGAEEDIMVEGPEDRVVGL